MNIDIDAIRQRHAKVCVDGPIWLDDGEPAHDDRGALLVEVDRLTEALRSIAYEGGDCLAVEAGTVTLPSSSSSIEDSEDDDETTCGVCAVCWAREALGDSNGTA